MGRELKVIGIIVAINLYFQSDRQPKSFLRFTRSLASILTLIVLQMLAASATPGATHVQQASNSNVGGATVTSFSAVFSNPTTTGNAIILGVTFGDVSPTITATDSQGNTYVQAVQTYDSAHRQGSAILYATNIRGGSNTVSIKFSQAVGYLALGVHEYSGIAASGALDVAKGAMGNGSTPSSGTVATTTSGDLIFGCGVEDSSGSGDTFSAGTSFVKRVDLSNAAAYADEDTNQAKAGSIAASWTLSPAGSWIATVAAFKTGGASANSQSPTTTPAIAGISPASGPVGSSVTISGTNFGATKGTSAVAFNGVSANTTSWSSTAVVATVPSGATTGNVNITVNGFTSNGVAFSVTQVSVAVSPSSSTLQVGKSQGFTATLQNDTQNKGVTWSLSGGGCSGSSCGTLSNATATGVTYTAPAAVPSPATVTLLATSVANTTKSSSAIITVATTPAISVSVSPSSASVQVSASTSFTASVQNDIQNEGVTWNLSGSGCSGSSCGDLTNPTKSSVTYTAPTTVPSVPTVTITATSVANTAKSAVASVTVAAAQSTGGGSGVPTFAENHVSGSSTQGNPVTGYILRLPNPSLAGNCIVVGFQYSNMSGVRASVSDDQGNSYSAPVQSTDGNQIVNLSYALNVAPGAQRITITFSGGSPTYVSALASEFYNVASASAIDGYSGNYASGSSVSAGAITPSVSGDLIYQYAIQDGSSSAINAWTQGANPWVLLSADLLDSSAAQYQVQSTAAAITPTLGMAPAQSFLSIALALKPASAGTAPPAGIRVVRVEHNAVPQYTSSPIRLQFPATGNLLVVSWIGAPGIDITGVTDGNGNGYASTGAAFGYGVSGDNQIYYAAGAATSSTMTGPTLATTGSQIGGSTAVLFDIRGAASAPYDSAAGRATASGNVSSGESVTGVTVSPTTANGLIITSIGIDSNTIVGVSPGNLLSTVPAPVSSPNPVDQNNGWALFYNSTAGPETFVWTSQGGAVDNWAAIGVAFTAAPH
jgi:hypothetical protein